MPLVAQASVLDFIPAAPAAYQYDKQTQFEGEFELAQALSIGVLPSV